MAKDIDKLFHDQLHDRSFEWKEAYWEAAEAAIIAAERKRKRRFIFFWWLGGALLLAGIVLGWGLKGLSVQDDSGTKVVKIETSRAVATEEEDCPESSIETISGQPVPHPNAIKPEPPAKTYAKTALGNALQPIDSEEKSINSTRGEQEEITDPAWADIALPRKRSTTGLPFLPGIPFFVKSDEILMINSLPEIAAPAAIEPASRRPAWSAGLGAGVQIGGLPKDVLPGAWAGAAVQGQLLGKWGWTLGLQYAVLQITPEEVDRTEQLAMGFGATHTQYVSEARSAHLLTAPLGVSYRIGKHLQLEAGAYFSYRMAVRGVVKELTYPAPWDRTAQEQSEYLPRLSSYYADQTQEFPQVTRSSIYARGWLNAGKENAFHVQPFAGMQYNMGSLSLSARIAYPGTASVGVIYWLR